MNHRSISAATPPPARIAIFTGLAILAHLALRYFTQWPRLFADLPLLAAIAAGGIPLLWALARHLVRLEFGADLLAGVSIVTAALTAEYLAAAIIVLMLSGGGALEEHAKGRAKSVLAALHARTPRIAHRRTEEGLTDIPIDQIAVGDRLVILPHEIAPVDATVVEGHTRMDESFLTGEPYVMSKTPGSPVLAGATNGDSAVVVEAVRLPADSRHAQIVQVLEQAERDRPRIRRLGDTLGAWYTPLALTAATWAWVASGDPRRFLAVTVIATPCPLLIAIPVAVLGAISLAARRGIIVKAPAVLEQIDRCAVMILDKTGTLTYGKPALTEVLSVNGRTHAEVLRRAASLEQYSKHPLAGAILEAANQAGLPLPQASLVSERPGEGLRGVVEGVAVTITGRAKVTGMDLPPVAPGLECIVLFDGELAGVLRFRDAARAESRPFVSHLGPKHGIRRVVLLSGDREEEVRYLAERVGITEMHFGKSPEEKVGIVRDATAADRTLFVGDGINDAPAMLMATVGVALGSRSEVTSEAADAVVLDSSLEKTDELMHIGRRMRRIALQSAVGGMALSAAGMAFAAAGMLPPVMGAVAQEAIDLAAVLNAVRVSFHGRRLADF
jgi:heavy metal translocating P-type ATPase